MTKPTDKQKAFLGFYLDRANKDTFFNKTASARAAGYSESPNSGQQAWKSPAVQEAIREWMVEHGSTKSILREKLFELLEAKQIKFFQKDGKVTDEREVEDRAIQAKAVEIFARLDGHNEPEKRELTGKDGKPLFEMDQKALKDAIKNTD